MTPKEKAAYNYADKMKEMRMIASVGIIKNYDAHVEAFIAGIEYAEKNMWCDCKSKNDFFTQEVKIKRCKKCHKEIF